MNRRSCNPAWVRDGPRMLQKCVPRHAWILHAFPRRWWILFSGQGSVLPLVSLSLFHSYFQKQWRTICDFWWDFKLSPPSHYRHLSPAKIQAIAGSGALSHSFSAVLYYKMCVTASYHHPTSTDRPRSAQVSESLIHISADFWSQVLLS